jgi:VanZ family protein
MRDWAPAVGWAAVIFFASSRSTLPVPTAAGLDKLYHFAAYLVLGVALAWGGLNRSIPALALAAIGIGYGGSDEFHQRFVPGRSPDLLDWFADSAGVIAGVGIGLPLFARLASRGPRSRTP